MSIDIRLIEPFLVVCETMSITRAAERMGVAQTRVSLLIKKLEDQLGFQVFRRSHRQIELTTEGARLRDKALELSAVRKSVDELVWELRGATRARLRLGTPRYAYELDERAQLMESFRQLRPSAKIELIDMRSPPMLQLLRAGELDLAFLTSPFDAAGLETLPIASTTAYMAIPREHELAKLNAVQIKATAGCRLAVYPELIGSIYYKAWFGPFADAGATLVEGLDDHPPSLVRFAANHRLLAVVHSWGRSPVVLDDALDMVVRPILDSDHLGLNLILARHARSLSVAAEDFWRLAKEQASERLRAN